MELLEFVTYVFEHLAGWGAPGLIIIVLLAVIVILWATLKAEREHSQDLEEKLLKVSMEAIAMIERISGR